jgi:hypothetical protein
VRALSERRATYEPRSYATYEEEINKYRAKDGLINEFKMMWALKARFPLHYTFFKQCGAHLAHEGNVENLFSRAGNLSDPNLDPHPLPEQVDQYWRQLKSMPSLSPSHQRPLF